LSAAINDAPQRVSIRATAETLPCDFEREVGFAILAHFDRELAEEFDGYDSRDGYRAVEEILNSGSPEEHVAIRTEVDRLYGITRDSLTAVWPAVKAVAEALLRHEELDREGFREAVGDTDLFTPVFAVQRAHGLLPPADVAP
jgi:hypothetical protein